MTVSRSSKAEPSAAAGYSLWADPVFRQTLKFLAIPGVFLGSVLVLGIHLPKIILYGFAVVMGMVLFFRSLKEPEWLLGVYVLFIPFSKKIVASIAPGLNASNVLLLMLLIAMVNTGRARGSLLRPIPLQKLILTFGALSSYSIITTAIQPGGVDYILNDVLSEFKAWLDPFIVFVAFSAMIKDGKMARRVAMYMVMGTMIVLMLGLSEWFDKHGLSSIEKSRLLGPQIQPNDFGAFIVYSGAPMIGLFLVYYRSWQAWGLTPYFLIMLRVLLGTFSRGAVLGLAAAGLAATYVRSKLFLVLALAASLIVVLVYPQILPESIRARFGQSENQSLHVDKNNDASIDSRYILWEAAREMTWESPFFGKGFKMFQVLKDDYTDIPVREADTHNMFLWISSQMGIPALLLFCLIMGKTFFMGIHLNKRHSDPFARALGIGGAAMVAGVMVVNMFGSRMINVETCGYVWIYMVVLGHLYKELIDNNQDVAPPPKKISPVAATRLAQRRVASIRPHPGLAGRKIIEKSP